VTAAVTPGHEQLFRWACDAADNFREMTAEDEAEFLVRAKDLQPVFSS